MEQDALHTPIPTQLSNDIHAYVHEQKKRCQERLGERISKELIDRRFSWAEVFIEHHYRSRIQRANELNSDDVRDAQRIAKTVFGEKNHPFYATCVDGRCMPTVMFSKPPHIGGALRTPAGTVTGFLPSQKPQSVYIDQDSYVVGQISRLLTGKPNQTIYYNLDSHLGCAARGQIHLSEGGQQSDDGLRSDVLAKWMTARGILELRKTLAAKKSSIADIVPTFFSFDPHTGGIVIGLEMHIDAPQVVTAGFTDTTLDMLTSTGKIVRSTDLLASSDTIDLIATYVQPKSADFRARYPASLKANWQAIAALYDGGNGPLFARITQKIRAAYDLSGWTISQRDSIEEHAISEETIKLKGILTLCNMVTRYSIAGIDGSWPYDHHQEDMIVITDGGYAPFPSIDAFSVFSHDKNALVPNTKLTIDLLRAARKSGKTTNPITDIPLSTEEFTACPIIISNKAIVKGLTVEQWEQIASVDFSLLFSTLDWDNPTTLSYGPQDITKLIQSIPTIKTIRADIGGILSLTDGMYELYDRIRLCMKDKQFRHMILSGNIIILNTIVDIDRYPRKLILCTI
jgi:hypothetical protein